MKKILTTIIILVLSLTTVSLFIYGIKSLDEKYWSGPKKQKEKMYELAWSIYDLPWFHEDHMPLRYSGCVPLYPQENEVTISFYSTKQDTFIDGKDLGYSRYRSKIHSPYRMVIMETSNWHIDDSLHFFPHYIDRKNNTIVLQGKDNYLYIKYSIWSDVQKIIDHVERYSENEITII